MKITSLEVQSNTRFGLYPELNHFIFTPDSTISVILGGNGSGKTTLLSLLTPYPPRLSEFKEGGFVKLVCTHKKSAYVLTTGRLAEKFSFLKNNKELNPTHRITIQHQLVLTHFGIDKDIHELMTDQTQFTTMSPGARKRWFINLSEVDYDYALGVYQQALDGRKATKTIWDHTKKKLSIAIGDRVHLDGDTIKKEIKITYKELDALMAKKVATPVSIAELNTQLAHVGVTITTQQKQISRLQAISDRDDNKTTGDNIAAIISGLQASIQQLIAKQEIHKDTILTLTHELGDSIDEPLNLEELHREKHTLIKRLRNVPLSIERPEDAYMALKQVSATLASLNADMPVYDPYMHDKSIFETNSGKLDQSNQELIGLEEELSDLLKNLRALEYARENDTVECPECKTSFKHGYDDDEYNKLLHISGKLNHRIERVTSTQEALSKQIDSYLLWASCQQQYIDLTQEYPLLQWVWDLIDIHHPDKISSIVSSSIGLAHSKVEDSRLQEQIDAITKQESIYTEIDHTAKQYIQQKLTDTNQLLHKLGTQQREYVEDLSVYERMVAVKEDIADRTSRVDTAIALEAELTQSLRTAVAQAALLESIQLIRIVITDKENQLARILVQQETLNTLEKEVSILSEQYTLDAEVVRTLSPTHGYLANSLLSFISAFVENMNQYLSHLWTYPLRILNPGQGGDEDLTYRFKLRVGDSDPADDVVNGSRAMCEVINLAFKLTILNSLGMSGYPIFLDELGSAFDVAHRDKLVGYIKELLVKLNASNIFIVSHYASLYDVFSNDGVDYTILNTEGVDTSIIGTGRTDCIEIL